MIPRVVEIATAGRFIHSTRGFLVVEESGTECGRVPLDDIGVLLISSPGISVSTNLISRLLERDASIVLCDEKYRPSSVLFPVQNHRLHQDRLSLQLKVSPHLKRRLWQTVVKAKIRNQAHALEILGRSSGPLRNFARGVLCGDSTNREAVAARYYWSSLFEKEFRRDQDGGGINALLNYGYAILRAATARSTVAAGLHPSLSIHHSNKENPWVLVDDLMEPYRPFVDIIVKRLVLAGIREPSPEAKVKLANLLHLDVSIENESSTIAQALHRLSFSLVESYRQRKSALIIADLVEQFSNEFLPGAQDAA